MVVSLPVWMIIADKKYRTSKFPYFIVVWGVALFALFFVKLAKYQAGPYTTSFTVPTVVENAEFYFGSGRVALLWLASIVFGVGYAAWRREYFVAWLFVASAAFFVPFAFLVNQRFAQYGTLTYLFFLLGVWALLCGGMGERWRNLVRYAGAIAFLAIFFKALDGPIRHFSANPAGRFQKQQVEFLKDYDVSHPKVSKYCFWPAKSGGEGADQVGVGPLLDWWFVGFGAAFRIFVNPEKTYELADHAAGCDVNLVFTNDRIELAD